MRDCEEGGSVSSANVFSARFVGPWSDTALRSRMLVKVDPLTGLGQLSPGEAATKLEATFKAIVVPTAQMIAAMRQLIERATGYCEHAYADSVSVRKLIYGQESTFIAERNQATCLTGLAGVGKSVLFDSFCRVFQTPKTVEVKGHARLNILACWRMTIRGRAGFANLVHAHFRDQTSIKPGRIPDCAVTEAAAQGIALILPDEFQFITSGSANAMMANLLFRLAQIGPPVIYACNFSMVNALWKRPQQDRDRLLLNPIILHPEQLGPDWSATVNACLNVAEEFSLIRTAHAIELLHDYTFGIKRGLRSLLVQAYVRMRKEKQTQVTVSHITAAYTSPEYKTMREDVENLVKGAVTPSLLRKDLACPFGGVPVVRVDNVVVGHPAARRHAANAAQAALLSILPPDVRDLAEAFAAQGSVAQPPKSKSPRRPPASAENLIGGANRFAARKKN